MNVAESTVRNKEPLEGDPRENPFAFHWENASDDGLGMSDELSALRVDEAQSFHRLKSEETFSDWIGRGQGGEPLVIRALRQPLYDLPICRADFREEATLMRLARGADVPGVYGFGHWRGSLAFSREWVAGESLEDVLLRRRRGEVEALHPRLAARWIADLGATVDRLHRLRVSGYDVRGIVLRGIRPSALHLGANGRLWLCDLREATRMREGVAPPAAEPPEDLRYVCPSQVLGLGLGAAADLYSLGVILWELISDEPMVRGVTALDAYDEIVGRRAYRVTPALQRSGLRQMVEEALGYHGEVSLLGWCERLREV